MLGSCVPNLPSDGAQVSREAFDQVTPAMLLSSQYPAATKIDNRPVVWCSDHHPAEIVGEMLHLYLRCTVSRSTQHPYPTYLGQNPENPFN